MVQRKAYVEKVSNTLGSDWSDDGGDQTGWEGGK